MYLVLQMILVIGYDIDSENKDDTLQNVLQICL